MKRIIIFVGLKIAEIIGVCIAAIVWYSVGKFTITKIWHFEWHDGVGEIMVSILLGFCVLVICGALIVLLIKLIGLIPIWIKWNWKKAGEILKEKQTKCGKEHKQNTGL